MKCLLPLILFSFCSCATNTGTGFIAGATVGAGAGALVAGGSGAIIGGAIGAVSGGLMGAYLDDRDRRAMEKSSPRTVDRMDRGDPLTLNDIIKLSHADVDDSTIIQYIKNTKSRYNLTQAQVRRLHDAGVSQQVIDYMIQSGE